MPYPTAALFGKIKSRADKGLNSGWDWTASCHTVNDAIHTWKQDESTRAVFSCCSLAWRFSLSKARRKVKEMKT